MSDNQICALKYLDQYQIKIKNLELKSEHLIELRTIIDNATSHIDAGAGFTGFYIGHSKISGEMIKTADKNLLKDPHPEMTSGGSISGGYQDSRGGLLAILIDEENKLSEMVIEARQLYDDLSATIDRHLGASPEAMVVKKRGLLGCTNEETAAAINYTKWHTSRLFTTGLEKLGAALKNSVAA